MLYYFKSESETVKFAKEISLSTSPGSCVALSGGLGVGKSVFARALMQGLGVQDTVMPSPTFSLVQTYEGRECRVAHMDWYRLSGAEEIEGIGIREYFSAPWIAIIEWPERALQLIPPHTLCIYLNYVSNNPEARELRRGRSVK